MNIRIMNDELMNQIEKYSSKFNKKRKAKEELDNEHDLLMDVFNISPEEKKKSAQYWGRELGVLWQELVKIVFANSEQIKDYTGALTVDDPEGESDEPCDLTANGYGIDTKYRIGSGDSKFTKKFRPNHNILVERFKLKPVLLILRDDNLKSPINRAKKEGWTVYTADDSYKFIYDQTGYDLKEFLKGLKGRY